MSAPPRKQPRAPPKKPYQLKQPECFPTPRETSDSEESVKSTATSVSDCNGAGTGDLTLVAEFDDLMRLMKQRLYDDFEDQFLNLAEQAKGLNMQWSIALQECKRLQAELDKKSQEQSDLEHRLGTARKLLDQERKLARRHKDERDLLESKINRASDLLFNVHRTRLPEETRQQLSFLNSTRYANGFDPKVNVVGMAHPDLSAIHEGHTTGSLLSDLSCSQSEDGLDTTLPYTFKTKKNPNVVQTDDEPAFKKRRSSNTKYYEIGTNDKVRATTTLTVSKDGPVTATSIIESIPSDGIVASAPPDHLDYRLTKVTPRTTNDHPNGNNRQHSLQAKTVMIPEACNVCGKRISFSKTAYKCKDCRSLCHIECSDSLPLPCIPSVNTPTQRGLFGVVADYAPPISPMVPALIVHCVKEIETRGLNEIGLYRIPGSERDVKLLKERFLRGKGVPSLVQIDVHVLCGTVKDFLRSLQEPLITQLHWNEFVRAVEAKEEDIAPALYELMSILPQPNRDTLAYLMLHLQRVSESPDCKMPVENLAKVFGPTIVGYSSQDLGPASLLHQTASQSKVMEHLINLPSDYWGNFINGAHLKTPSNKLKQTPSTDSLLGTVNAKYNLYTPPYTMRSSRKKKTRFFQLNTPE